MDSRTRKVASLHSSVAVLSGLFSDSGSTELRASAEPRLYEGCDLPHGACISLLTPIGALELGLHADPEGCRRAMHCLFGGADGADSEEAELQDTLGELSNMVMGRLKQSIIDECEAEYLLGVPRWVQDSAADRQRESSIPVWSQTLSFGTGQGQIRVTWSERNTAVLFQQALDWIDVAGAGLELAGLTDLLAILEEASEAIPAEDKARAAQVDRTIGFVAQLINGACAPLHGPLTGLRAFVSALLESARSDLRARGLVCDDPMKERDRESGPDSSYPLDLSREIGDVVGEFLSETRAEVEALAASLERTPEDNVQTPDLANFGRVYPTMRISAGLLGLRELHDLASATVDLIQALARGERGWDIEGRTALERSGSLVLTVLSRVDEAVGGDGFVRATPEIADHAKLLESLAGGRATAKMSSQPPVRGTLRAVGRSPVPAPFKVRRELVTRLADLDVRLARLELDFRSGRSDAADDLYAARNEIVLIYNEMSLVPIRSLMRKVCRAGRDLSRDTRKVVRMKVDDQVAAIPFRIHDAMTAPLLELVRNAVEHGIEDVGERTSSGKELLATVSITARKSPGGLLLQVSDDGRGIDLPKWREQTAETDDSRELGNVELVERVTSERAVDGRRNSAPGRGLGIGMVRATVEALGGRVELRTTFEQGTVVEIEIPVDEVALPADEVVEPETSADEPASITMMVL